MKKKFIIITCTILGIASLLGFRSGFNNQVILNTLTSECDCQEITKNNSLHGLTFSKEHGMNLGDTYTYTLKNCQFDNFEKKMNELNEALTREVEDFCSSEIVILELESNGIKDKRVVLENCDWTAKEFQKQ